MHKFFVNFRERAQKQDRSIICNVEFGTPFVYNRCNFAVFKALGKVPSAKDVLTTVAKVHTKFWHVLAIFKGSIFESRVALFLRPIIILCISVGVAGSR